MKLLEYQAHELFRKYGIDAARGVVVRSAEELRCQAAQVEYPVVLKAQLATGGRGKAGGIQVARTPAEFLEKGTGILGLRIKGLPVKRIFLTSLVDARRELYLSITLDRKSKAPVLIFSAEGGMEINAVADADPSRIIRTLINPLCGIQPSMIQYILDRMGLDDKLAPQLSDVVNRLYSLFIECDCLLAEINPLVVDSADHLFALDAKVEIDDNALLRHPDLRQMRQELTEDALVLRAREWDFLYIPIGQEGTVGVISNGSGMIMSSIDLLSKKNLRVVCALDLGGGATRDRIKEAIHILFLNERVKIGLINIFGGITRCDEVAQGIRQALEAKPHLSIIVRMEGTNKEEGVRIISAIPHDVDIVPDLESGVERVLQRSAV